MAKNDLRVGESMVHNDLKMFLGGSERRRVSIRVLVGRKGQNRVYGRLMVGDAVDWAQNGYETCLEV